MGLIFTYRFKNISGILNRDTLMSSNHKDKIITKLLSGSAALNFIANSSINFFLNHIKEWIDIFNLNLTKKRFQYPLCLVMILIYQ